MRDSCILWWYQLSVLHVCSGAMSATHMKTVEEMLSDKLQIPTESGWILCLWEQELVVLLWAAGVSPSSGEITRRPIQGTANNPNTIMAFFSFRSVPWLFLMDRGRWDRDGSQLLPHDLCLHPQEPVASGPLRWSLRAPLIHLADSAGAFPPHIWSLQCSQPSASFLFLDVGG